MDKTIQQAFMDAVRKGAKRDYATLIRYGADKDAALVSFTEASDIKNVTRMFDMGADPNAFEGYAINRAIFASKKKEGISVLKLLLERGGKPTLDHLESAALHDNLQAADELLKQPGIDITKASKAFGFANNAMAVKLIDAGYPAAFNEDLDRLARNGAVQAVKKFLAAGVKPTANTVEQSLFSGSDAVITAVINAALKDGISQKERQECIGTAIFTNNAKAFKRLVKAGPVDAEEIHGTAEHAIRGACETRAEYDAAGLVKIYQQSCKLAGIGVNSRLCNIAPVRGSATRGGFRPISFGAL